MHRIFLFVAVLLAAGGISSGPAAADDRSVCSGSDSTPDAAISACQRLISSGRITGTDLARIFHRRGFAYGRKGDHNRAMQDYDETIRLDPKSAVTFINRADIWTARGIFDRAIADLDKAIGLEPKSAIAYAHRSSAWAGKRDFDRVIADTNEAIRLDPKLWISYNNRGYAWREKGDFDRAIADLDEAIRLSPKIARTYNNRSIAWRNKGQLDRAIADADQAIRLDPALPRSYVSRGLAYEAKGDPERARTDFNAALASPIDNYFDNEAKKTARDRLAVLTTPTRPAIVQQPQQKPVALAAPPPAAASAPAAPERRIALVIGNGNYRHATRLPNPANDAADMSQALRKLGFDVVEGRDLDKRGMDEKLREFGRKLDNAGLALFFYAGHGMQVGGKNYLVPVDAKLERAGDLNLDAVDVGNVMAQMEAERRVNLVFLDACRDNPLARSFARSLGTRSTAVGQGLATIQSAIGTMIAFATQPEAVALDGEGRNSPFTTALLKHLSTPGVDIGALMRRVRADVIAATREKQVPWDHSSLIGEVVLAR